MDAAYRGSECQTARLVLGIHYFLTQSSQLDGRDGHINSACGSPRMNIVLKVQARPHASRELNLGIREGLPEEVTLDFRETVSLREYFESAATGP